MIQVQGVSQAYDQIKVVDGVDFTLPDQGMTAIIGPNGAGKSTLLSMMSRLQRPQAGQILIDQLDVHQTPSRQLAKILAILKQENHLATRLTVEDLVSFGRYPYSRGRLTPEDKQKVEEALGFLALTDLRYRYLDELSGGQRQRAYIAMVLCQDTRYILLDEPLNNLDMHHAVSMMQLLRRAADQMHKQVILVLHDINFAAAYADWILAMKDGQLRYQGPPQEVISAEIMRDLYQLEMEIQLVKGRPVAHYYR
ncbi:ATP-binding cassette domain-containing protein [Marinospirillum sp. MEB164]|uniref:ATP-binding cassette domain-containing protein n=1 Tax=Marinospirillum alkalitolerans TaxID=3123374 RepID=A0ABW8PWJ6_9GAMM